MGIKHGMMAIQQWKLQCLSKGRFMLNFLCFKGTDVAQTTPQLVLVNNVDICCLAVHN